ncbi:MAG TPA: efflux RND transporter periplasmic adaptor subunit [Flavobacteriales bacterium]|nr:efflux RND transporter periplasmic adaptor subunit [Flavobacteriales bacterium]
MKTFKTLFLIAMVITLLWLLKYLFFPAPVPVDVKGGKGKGPGVVEIYVAEPRLLDNHIFISGTVMANEEVNLSPEVQGKVLGIYFKEGTTVKKGQLLVKLNDAGLRAELKKLQAQEKLLAAQEQRMVKLLEVKGISQEEYETISTQLTAVRADIEINRTRVDETELRAPFDGKIGIKNISEGSFINTTTIIALLQQSNPVKIDFYIPEKYAGLVQKGDTFGFTVEANQKRFVATVAAIDPAIDAATRTLRIRATAPNANGELIPGAFARINFLLEHTEATILVPTEAIIPVQKGKKVFVVRNGKAEEIMVETGLRTDTHVQVITGLQKGDSVVTRGIMQLKPGAPVKVKINAKVPVKK